MNDNQNNFVTRSTSRVLSEPGGKSSAGFLFGGGGGNFPQQQQPKVSSSSATTMAPPPTIIVTDKKKEGVIVAAPPAAGALSPRSTPFVLGNSPGKKEEASPGVPAVGEKKCPPAGPALTRNDGVAVPPVVSVVSSDSNSNDESAINAAARIKSKNEANSFSLFGCPAASAAVNSNKSNVSSNAFATSSTTNSYNVLTDRSTSRVVSLCWKNIECAMVLLLLLLLVYSTYSYGSSLPFLCV
jgi:hypothetical protein